MKEYKLEIDPRILELLGPNLYTNIYYILAELISNAYDADAKNVYIIANKDDIQVEDDGHGMSYSGGEIKNYLNVARVSRETENDSLTRSGSRRKMGRKGVGKLAALSVSENVKVLTVSNGEKSGFILSRTPNKDKTLEAIPESDISFTYIKDHGSLIIMQAPQYRLHKSISAIKRNLLKIFPLVNSEFRIHIIRDRNHEVIDDFDTNIIEQLCSLITLGKDYSNLSRLFKTDFPEKREKLILHRESENIPVLMKDKNKNEREYHLIIEGWIGTYKSTRGRKSEMTDFPDNFISLFANKKMGEFNILPLVGQNKLNEVYVVGQLHVDLFELTELPDMALSNRQGYKSDDPRYTAVLEFVRNDLLQDILKKRDLFTDFNKAEKKKKNIETQKENEKKLKESMNKFKNDVSRDAANDISKLTPGVKPEDIQAAVKKSINENSFNIGLKKTVDSDKKKVLISQTFGDKPFSDILYQMLLFNNVPAGDILYTNCDDEIARIPEDYDVYEYLRDFFVESYSNQKIFVLFITSENTKNSWGAITEVGASWITQVDNKIFNIHPFRPEHPLNDHLQWQTTHRDTPTSGNLWMYKINADIFCQKIESVCDKLNHTKKSREKNMQHLSTLISIVDNP